MARARTSSSCARSGERTEACSRDVREGVDSRVHDMVRKRALPRPRAVVWV